MPKILPKTWYKKVIDKLALKHNKDPRVIEYIAHYPFSFVKRIVRDDYDTRPIRLRHLGVFALRKEDGKENIYQKRMEGLKRKPEVLIEAGLYETVEQVNEALDAMTRDEIQKLYRRFRPIM